MYKHTRAGLEYYLQILINVWSGGGEALGGGPIQTVSAEAELSIPERSGELKCEPVLQIREQLRYREANRAKVCFKLQMLGCTVNHL